MTDNRLIAFLSDGVTYGVPIGVVVEVLGAGTVEAVQGSRIPFEGLMIYRGSSALPVFSLGAALGRGRGAGGKMMMVVRAGDELVGFRVDRIAGFVAPAPSAASAGEPKEEEGRGISGVVPHGDGELFVLDVQRLFGGPPVPPG